MYDHFRAFARRPVHLNASVEPVDGTWQQAARIRDLGLGGACLEVAEPLNRGTPVRLQLRAPHLWDPLDLRAFVAWGREAEGALPARMGLRFEHSSGKPLRWLVELLGAENYDQ